MSWFLKVCMVAATVGVMAPSVAFADSAKPQASSEEASDSAAAHDRSFDETRDFMKKHSEESKRTGKM